MRQATQARFDTLLANAMASKASWDLAQQSFNANTSGYANARLAYERDMKALVEFTVDKPKAREIVRMVIGTFR